MTTAQDRDILRRLAAQVRELADQPIMSERRNRWRDFNDLKPTEPMVLCFPEGAWGELLPSATMQCQDEFLRQVEWNLRHQIYTVEVLQDDQALEPCYSLQPVVHVSGYGVEIPTTHGENRGSYVWDAPIKDLDRDFAKLKQRTLNFNAAATQQRFGMLQQIFGDILPVRLRATPFWTAGLTQDLIKLMGLEELMMAMYDNPAGLHRIMAFMRDDMMHLMDWWESSGLLTFNNENDYVGSGGVGYTRQLPRAGRKTDAPITFADRWAFAESQETVGVGPEQFAEFILPYQVPMMRRMGLVCYGCCEPVHSRIDLVMKEVPRLRRVSVSPWADQEIMAAKLAGKCVFSRKPNPAHVCVDFNEEAVRHDLRQTLEVARGCNVELVMKDTHTVQNHPDRLARWVRIAREEIDRVHAVAR